MAANIRTALQYWLQATLYPSRVFERFIINPQKLAISFWINFIFALMYAITPLLLQWGGLRPAIPPWMPLDAEVYYLYQPLWTLPWGLATWIMIAGISHLLALAGRQEDNAGSFEDALAVVAIGWVAPSFYFMWLPETFWAPFAGRGAFPAWVEIMRLSVLPVIWQVYLIALGMRKSHNTGRGRALLIGLVSEAVFFCMFLGFMR